MVPAPSRGREFCEENQGKLRGWRWNNGQPACRFHWQAEAQSKITQHVDQGCGDEHGSDVRLLDGIGFRQGGFTHRAGKSMGQIPESTWPSGR